MIDYPMPGGGAPPDVFKGFREELGNIEKRREQKQARVLEMASRIELADQSTMFGGDYSEAQQMAQWMTDHLDDFASSTEGLIEFQQMTQQLSNFIDASEAYKKQNFGSADGNAQAGTWLGWYQRNASGVNPYGDYIDEREARSYETAYMGLQRSRDLQYDESGRPILSNRGRAENPFMPQLGTNLNIADGYNYYDAKSEAFKNDHQNAEAAANWTRRQIDIDPLMRRRVANLYLDSIKAQDPERSQWTLDELMKNPELVDQAINAYVADAGRAWEDRFGEEVESRAEQIFTGGVTNEGVPTVMVNDQTGQNMGELSTTEDIAAVVGEDTGNLLLALEGDNYMENTGFSMLNNLTDPITSEFSTALTDDERITAVNVDQLGNIYIEVETLVPDIPEGMEDVQNMEFPDRKERSVRKVSASSDADLHASLVNYLTPDLYTGMMNQSEAFAISARRRRINQRFENAEGPPVSVGETFTEDIGVQVDEVPREELERQAMQTDFYRQRLEDLGWSPKRQLGRGLATAMDFIFGNAGYESATARNEKIRQQALAEAVAELQRQRRAQALRTSELNSALETELKPQSDPSNPSRDELLGKLTEEQRQAYDNKGGVAVLANNPGNLRPYEGYDGPVYTNENGAYRVFNTPQEGLDALEKDLKVKREGEGAVGDKMRAGTLPSGARTPDKITMYDIISVYAPHVENDPEGYARSIAAFAKSMGYPEVSPSTPANQVPLKLLMQAIVKVESGPNYNLLSNAGLLPLSSDLAQN